MVFTPENQIELCVMCQKTKILLLFIYLHPEEHRKGRQDRSQLGRHPTLTMTQERYTQLKVLGEVT